MAQRLKRGAALALVLGWAWWYMPAGAPAQWTDSYDYVGPGAALWWRPWVTVAFWQAFGASELAVRVLHCLSVACWARLGWVAGGPLGVAAALTFSGTDLVRSWNSAVLTEALAISGLAWLMAETVRVAAPAPLYRDPEARPPGAPLLWCWAAVLATARLASAPMVLGAAWAVWWSRCWWDGTRHRYRYARWPLVVALAAVAVPVAQQSRHELYRWQQNENIALVRLPAVPVLSEWMAASGMPPVPERWRGIHYANLDQMADEGQPALAAYIRGPFRRAYAAFLVSHPEYLVGAALTGVLTVPPGTLNPGRGIPWCDALWRPIAARVGLWCLLAVAVVAVPWAAVAQLGGVLLAYHLNVNEFERLNATAWAWGWATAAVSIRFFRHEMRHLVTQAGRWLLRVDARHAMARARRPLGMIRR